MLGVCSVYDIAEVSRSLEIQVQQTEDQRQELHTALQRAAERIKSYKNTVEQTLQEHTMHTAVGEKQLERQSTKIKMLEKTVRTLQNDKAILSAAVEARDSRLSSMTDLQMSLKEVESKLGIQEALQHKLKEAKMKCKSLRMQTKSAEENENVYQEKLAKHARKVLDLMGHVNLANDQRRSCQKELSMQQIAIQSLKQSVTVANKNAKVFPRKLARYVGIRNGRSIWYVEIVVADNEARRQEIVLLRDQKRKALEEMQYYRAACEQSRAAQKMAGLDNDMAKVLEQNLELERLLSELIKYVSAKEMQLETLKQVNDALKSELGSITKGRMTRNMGKNDI
jgi:chromosome segregation ATPase